MCDINYQKRKNIDLFKCLEKIEILNLSKIQNYIPIYNRFFSLNETNYNNINLNNKLYITNAKENFDSNIKSFQCCVKNITTQKIKTTSVFFKLAPLLDIYKYLVGKYNINDKNLFNLPQITSTEHNCNSKLLDYNNSAYIDGFFLFLSSNLLHNHNFIHGLDYFGSFLAIKNNYTVNIFDDLEYLNGSDFFNKNKNTLFKIDNYEHLFNNDNKLKPIKIDFDSSAKSKISINSFNNEEFDSIFYEPHKPHVLNEPHKPHVLNEPHKPHVLNELNEISVKDFMSLTNNDEKNITTLKSTSTCSSRTSHTSIENCENCEIFEIEHYDNHDDNDDDNEHDNEHDNDDNYDDNEHDNDDDNEHDNDDDNVDDNVDSNWEDVNEENSDDDDETIIEEIINVYIKQFPIQVICMENCENTFDDLVLNNDLNKDEWLSAFLQIIMILITYQKAFSFTHNDLHLNNVMYNHTNKKYIIYKYKNNVYKVPTFGRLFKIIDFGRSIYKFNNNLFCSDSFQNGNDAATQYNTEPYFNESKPRLEPNYSFDLCRLACSIFDYIIEDLEEIKDISKITDPIKKLIVEWCLDDKGINLLYKNNGVDRYPDFKLYKMIARHVHNHTPQAQLERPEFQEFLVNSNEQIDVNIDNIPELI